MMKKAIVLETHFFLKLAPNLLRGALPGLLKCYLLHCCTDNKNLVNPPNYIRRNELDASQKGVLVVQILYRAHVSSCADYIDRFSFSPLSA